MNAESIKMIVDMIQNPGSGGKEAFIWWVVCSEVLPYVVGLLLGGTAIKCAYRLFSQLVMWQETIAFFCNVRDVNGLGSSGPLIDSELARVRDFINKSLNSQKQV